MTFSTTDTINRLSSQARIEPQLILDIDGFNLFSVDSVTQYWTVGDGAVIGAPGLVVGGLTINSTAKSYVDLKSGTTKQLSQQLEQQRSLASVQSFKVRLIDKNEELTALFSPGNTVDDVLGQDADVYISYQGESVHPVDSVRAFAGQVTGIDFGSGWVELSLSSPEEFKRTDIFQQISTELDGDIASGTTAIPLTTTQGMLEPADVLTCYVRIEDEIVQYTGISGNSLTGCTRAQFDTTAVSHDDEAEAVTFYRLIEDPIPLALKIMLSGDGVGVAYADENVFSFQDGIDNAIFFSKLGLLDRLGVTVGDTVTTTGATSGSNDVTSSTIISLGSYNARDYIVVEDNLVDELTTSASCSFYSRFNTLPSGCKMKPKHVDVAEHITQERLLGGNLVSTLDFYLKDTINAADFIGQELYLPAGYYTIPRKGRSSLGATIPPISEFETKTFSADNIKAASKLVIRRTTNKDFYNAIVFKYDEDAVEDKFLAGLVTYSADSQNRIQVGNKPLKIVSKGLRKSGDTTNILNASTRRYLDRYQYGAETIKIDVLWSAGWTAEVGDTIVFDGSDISVSDTKNGSRDFQPRLMEITKKSMDVMSGKVSLTLTDTAFALDGRYGTVGPSSIVGTGSTTTKVKIVRSYATTATELERDKWNDYVGFRVLVRAPDWSYSDTAVLSAHDPTENDALNLESALSFTPSSTDIVDMPQYDDDFSGDVGYFKGVHCFFDPQVTIASGTSQTVFTVASGEGTKFFNGCPIRIHDDDFSDDKETTVSNISGDIITVSESLGFTPSSAHLVDLIGFSDDNGAPYRLI